MPVLFSKCGEEYAVGANSSFMANARSRQDSVQRDILGCLLVFGVENSEVLKINNK